MNAQMVIGQLGTSFLDGFAFHKWCRFSKSHKCHYVLASLWAQVQGTRSHVELQALFEKTSGHFVLRCGDTETPTYLLYRPGVTGL